MNIKLRLSFFLKKNLELLSINTNPLLCYFHGFWGYGNALAIKLTIWPGQNCSVVLQENKHAVVGKSQKDQNY